LDALSKKGPFVAELKLVLELQRDALDSKVAVSDLLRKALVVATKLGVKEFQEWVTKELTGYWKDDDAPAYREVRGEVRAWNPYHGWQPVIFENGEAAERLSRRHCAQPAPELEALLDSKELQMPFPPELARTLTANARPFRAQITLLISRSAIVGVLQSIRTTVLNWAMRLEAEGILGEGLTFTAEEKQAAARLGGQAIFNAPVGSVQVQGSGRDQIAHVTLNTTVDTKAVERLVAQIEAALEKLDLPAEIAAEVVAELETAKAQISSPKPKVGIIRSALGTVHRVLEGTAGNMAGTLLAEIVKIMAQLGTP
jgi:hypothetical protein